RLPQGTCRLCRSVSLPHNVGSSTSAQYYVGVWPLLFRSILESVFRGSSPTSDPFSLRALFAFFGLAYGVACLISPRLPFMDGRAESCCTFLESSTVARCRSAAARSSRDKAISLVTDRRLNSRIGPLSILTSPLGLCR